MASESGYTTLTCAPPAHDIKLITFPAQIDVFYMIPMSLYTTSDPHFRVVADYRGIKRNGSPMMKLRLRDVPSNLQNVHLSALRGLSN